MYALEKEISTKGRQHCNPSCSEGWKVPANKDPDPTEARSTSTAENMEKLNDSQAPQQAKGSIKMSPQELA